MRKFVVNNISFLHTSAKDYDPSQVKTVGVCINFLDNKTYELHDVLAMTKDLQSFTDDDLFITKAKIDDYDGEFVNLMVFLESRSNKDLIGLMREFSDKKAMLVVGDDGVIFLTKDEHVIKQVKKVYPVAVPYIGSNDQYVVHHNFFNGLLPLTHMKNNQWYLQLYTAKTHDVIRDLLHKKFEDDHLIGDSMDVVLDRFYNAFI